MTGQNMATRGPGSTGASSKSNTGKISRFQNCLGKNLMKLRAVTPLEEKKSFCCQHSMVLKVLDPCGKLRRYMCDTDDHPLWDSCQPPKRAHYYLHLVGSVHDHHPGNVVTIVTIVECPTTQEGSLSISMELIEQFCNIVGPYECMSAEIAKRIKIFKILVLSRFSQKC